MSLKLNSSGGGSVTLQEPSTASNLTMTLPTTTGTAVIQNASNNLLMNSGYGSDAVAYGCRAWVNFNGQGTVAIRASANVSSITDNGVGNYTMNFTNAMPDINYVGLTGGSYNRFVSTTNSDNSATRTVSATYVGTNYSGAAADLALVQVAIIR